MTEIGDGTGPAGDQPWQEVGSVLADHVAGVESSSPIDARPDSMGDTKCPYPGSAAFDRHQAQWFFGRKQATEELIRLLRTRLDGGEPGPLAVVAPSGAGRTSLLAAGLIPALLDHNEELPGSQTWTVVWTTPGTDPLASLATQVATKTGADPADAKKAAAGPRKFADFLSDIVISQGGKQGDTSHSARIVLIVDEFEKVFIECRDARERENFINALCAAACSADVLVVLGVRADFYSRCLANSELKRALRDALMLGPMTRDELHAIIIGPAECQDRKVDPKLVEQLLSDLGVPDGPGTTTVVYDPGALAWLARALRATWQHSRGPMLTVDDYKGAGRISEAIVTTAERVYAELSESDQEIAKQLLLRLVQVNTDTRDARCWVPRGNLLQGLPAHLQDLPGYAERSKQVLEILGRERLLTLGTYGDVNNSNPENVEITHDALLSWPPLAGWIGADEREWRRISQSLSAAAEVWDGARSNGQDPFRLFRFGYRLEYVREWTDKPQYKDQISKQASDFLKNIFDQEERARQAREEAERRRIQRRRWKGFLLVVITVVAAGFGFYKSNLNAATERLALANKFVAASRALAAKQPDAAMVAAVAAFHISQVPETQGALLSAQDQFFAGRFTGPSDDSLHTAMFSYDGRTLVTAGDNGTARLWDVANRRPLAWQEGALAAHADVIFDAEFSPDGRIVATAGKDGAVRLWDVDGRQQIGTFPSAGLNHDLFVATFSHDGRIVATAGKDGTARLWDVDGRRQFATLNGHTAPVHGARFSPDDRLLATVSEDGTAQLWDVANHQKIGLPLNGHNGRVNNVAFSSTGILATVNDDTTAKLWDVGSHQLIATLNGHTDRVNSAAFSPNGHILVTGSNDGTARLWDVVTGQQIGAFMGTNAITGVTFNPDGHTVATAGEDSVVRLWDTRSAILFPAPPAIGYDLAFSPDGHTLATSGEDGTARLWNVATREQITKLEGHDGAIHALAFSPNGLILATAGEYGTVALWDALTHQFIVALKDHPGAVHGVAFSPDGRTLVAAGDGGTVWLWDMTTKQHISLPPKHTGAVRAAAFSLNGSMLATADDDAIIWLWDTTTHQTISEPLFGFPGAINKVVFSPDGRTLATAGDDATVRLWDVTTHKFVEALSGHTGKVKTVAFSPDGRTLVTASSDGTTKLWNVNDRHLIATLAGHTDAVYGAAFSPNGVALLATAGADRTVRLWDLDVNRVADHICHIIGTIRPEQWAPLLPDLPYQSICQ